MVLFVKLSVKGYICDHEMQASIEPRISIASTHFSIFFHLLHPPSTMQTNKIERQSLVYIVHHIILYILKALLSLFSNVEVSKYVLCSCKCFDSGINFDKEIYLSKILSRFLFVSTIWSKEK